MSHVDIFLQKGVPFSSVSFLYIVSLGLASYRVIISSFDCLSLLLTESHLKGFLHLL